MKFLHGGGDSGIVVEEEYPNVIPEKAKMTRNAIKEEFDEIDKKNGWHFLFQEVKEKCEKEAKEKSYSVNASSKNQNRMLNRYRDVHPYDHSRIVIHRGKVDYINANLVKLERANRQYILTQGPLKETIGHFWLMIWEQNTKAIVMLNKLLEKKQIKCHMYWPERIGSEHSLHMDDVGLTVEYLNCEEYANFSKRIFRLIDVESNTSREVIQFHYTTWPDFAVPSSPVAFLQFLKRVRESGALESDVGPAVIHCSAGIGRSGTFCLVDCCLVIVEKEGEIDLSVQEILYELRKYRMGLIQTPDQLYFSYQAVIEGIKLLKDPNFNNYEEVPLIAEGCNDDIHEIPPPLPPRIQSLQVSSVINKPLPTIPNSESVYEDLVTGTSTAEDIDEDGHNPPDSSSHLQQTSIDKILAIEENTILMQTSQDPGNIAESTNDNEKVAGLNGNNNKNLEKGGSPLLKYDMDATNDERLNDSQVRRRKRAEKQLALENKIHNIKRKQREVDEQTRISKKRKSLLKYILAGVVIGSVCIYAYSKFS